MGSMCQIQPCGWIHGASLFHRLVATTPENRDSVSVGLTHVQYRSSGNISFYSFIIPKKKKKKSISVTATGFSFS